MTKPLFSKIGMCPICEQPVEFNAWSKDLRDTYLCGHCGSIPRERALMLAIRRFAPRWRDMLIHESSPSNRSVSAKLAAECVGYRSTQYQPNVPPGTNHPVDGWRCENLERQTFADAVFDLVVTQDVLEHLFNPEDAFREIYRTLKPGGAMISTTPIVFGDRPSEQCAKLSDDGEVIHIFSPDYHRNPVDENGSLVTFYWGRDIKDRIDKTAQFWTEIISAPDPFRGVEGPLIEVIVSLKSKRPSAALNPHVDRGFGPTFVRDRHTASAVAFSLRASAYISAATASAGEARRSKEP